MIYSLWATRSGLWSHCECCEPERGRLMRKVTVENVRMRLVELPASGGGSTGGALPAAPAKLISPNDPFVIVYVMCPAG